MKSADDVSAAAYDPSALFIGSTRSLKVNHRFSAKQYHLSMPNKIELCLPVFKLSQWGHYPCEFGVRTSFVAVDGTPSPLWRTMALSLAFNSNVTSRAEDI